MKTAKDVIERYYIANKSIFEARKNMLNTIDNARTVGLSPVKAYEIFEKRGLKGEYDELTAGVFDPFVPSDLKTTLEEEM